MCARDHVMRVPQCKPCDNSAAAQVLAVLLAMLQYCTELCQMWLAGDGQSQI